MTAPPGSEQGSLIQELLASVFMSVGAAVAILDVTGQFIAVNPAFSRLLRYGARGLEGRNFWTLIAADDRRHAKATSDGSSTSPITFYANMTLGDGTTAPMEVILTAVDQARLKRFRLLTIREQARYPDLTLSAKSDPVVVAGKIQLVGLAEVRAALGPRWEAHAERAMMIAESIVRRRISAGDVFTRTEDHGFVICFADGSEDEAAFRAAAIAREIRGRLIGEDAGQAGSTVTAITQSLGVGPEETENGRPNLGTLEQRLDAGRAELERRARAELSVAMAVATLQPEQLFDRFGNAVPIVIAALQPEMQDHIDVAMAILPKLDELDVDIDLLKLTLTAEAALSDIAGGRSGAYLVPLDFGVFAHKKRQDRYIALCRNLQDAVRQRITFMLSGVPQTVSQNRLFEVIRLLKPFGKGIGMDLAGVDRLPTDLAQSRIPLVSLSAEEILDSARQSPVQLNRLVRQIQLNAARLVIRHIHGEAERSAVCGLGADLISFATERRQVDGPARPPPGGGLESALFTAAFNTAPGGVLVCDARRPDTPIIMCNPAFCAMTGYSPDELIGRNPRLLQGPATDRKVTSDIREAIATGRPIRRELLNYKKDGTTFWNDVVITPVLDEGGRLMAFVGMQTDITEKKKAEKSRREIGKLLSDIVESIPGYVFQRVMNPDGRFEYRYLSPSFRRLIGLQEGEAPGTVPFDWVHPDDRAFRDQSIRQSVSELTPLLGDYRLLTKTGRTIWVRTHSRPTRLASGQIVWNGVSVDVTPEKTAAQQLADLAERDALTQQLNRHGFRSHLRKRIADVVETGGSVAILRADIAGFQAINDALGAAVGDEILKVVAERIAGSPSVDLVGREGRDEFTAILATTSDGEALDVAKEVCRSIARTIEAPEQSVTLFACIGIAIYPTHIAGSGTSPDQIAEALFKAAGVALHAAKRAGPGRCELYSTENDDRLRNRVLLLQSMHHALQTEQFAVHFQPFVDLESGRIIGAEALIRWEHPELGIQRPDQFIPLAEQCGLIVPLGIWVLKKVLSYLREWDSIGLGRPRVAINVSAIQMGHPDAVRDLRDPILESGIDPARIEFELTETTLIDPSPSMRATFAALRETGISIAIDDFGTGYSSFGYLRSLPIDTLKIDQSFIRHMEPGSNDEAIVRGILGIARDLDLNVIVEGIETAEQRGILVREGCRIGQGYYYSMPLVPEDFAWLLAQDSPLPIARRESETGAASGHLALRSPNTQIGPPSQDREPMVER